MLLVIDVGNTNTVLGLMRGLDVHQTFRISTVQRTTDELGVLILHLFANRGIDVSSVRGAIISTVVPSQLYTIEKACRRYLDVEPLVVGRRLRTGMRVRTENPREVGADRIVNAIGAWHRVGRPCVVVDFGTATTFDCIDHHGDYVGGAIAPGFRISEEALFAKTAQLPRVEVQRPPTAIGRNTVHAMQSGLYWGYVGLVDSLARRCREELDPSAAVVATGGLATLIAEASEVIEEVQPFLTLEGLARLHALNTGGR